LRWLRCPQELSIISFSSSPRVFVLVPVHVPDVLCAPNLNKQTLISIWARRFPAANFSFHVGTNFRFYILTLRSCCLFNIIIVVRHSCVPLVKTQQQTAQHFPSNLRPTKSLSLYPRLYGPRDARQGPTNI